MKVEPSVQLECLGNETVLTWCGRAARAVGEGTSGVGCGCFPSAVWERF